MKRFLVAIRSTLIICGLLLLMTVVSVKSGNPAYSITEYPSIATATVDGKWTTADEWTDTPVTTMSGNATGKFGYNIQDFTNLGLEWIVEIFTDNTNDTGDYWQICLDDQNGGGAAPQPGDYMIEIVGHTTLKVYEGTGTGWAQITPAAGEITWRNTIAASPWNSTPHWILEIVDSSKVAGAVQVPNPPPTGMRIAAYDARTHTLAAWPPNSRANIPDQWGVISLYSMDPIPEVFSLGVVLPLSSVAVVASFYCLRKRQKYKNVASLRQEKSTAREDAHGTFYLTFFVALAFVAAIL